MRAFGARAPACEEFVLKVIARIKHSTSGPHKSQFRSSALESAHDRGFHRHVSTSIRVDAMRAGRQAHSCACGRHAPLFIHATFCILFAIARNSRFRVSDTGSSSVVSCRTQPHRPVSAANEPSAARRRSNEGSARGGDTRARSLEPGGSVSRRVTAWRACICTHLSRPAFPLVRSHLEWRRRHYCNAESG
jgi:hypothetical protein